MVTPVFGSCDLITSKQEVDNMRNYKSKEEVAHMWNLAQHEKYIVDIYNPNSKWPSIT